MTGTLTILWPKKLPPEIEEVAFSYDFCRNMSRDLCMKDLGNCLWLEFPVDQYDEQIAHRVEGDRVLVVTDPEIVLSAVAVNSMIKSIAQRHAACGPVYNQTNFSAQIAELSIPYVNVATYLEMAQALSEKKGKRITSIDRLDPSCILYQTEDLRSLVRSGGSINGHSEAIVDSNALVHRFGDYYDGDREDLITLVPYKAKKVLDVGCAKGGYGKRLRKQRPGVHITGVELNPVMAEIAEGYYDEVITASIEDADLPGDFDLINCGDVLEHLRDPWSMLKCLYGLLKPGGYLVLSVPNIAHWSIVRDLLNGRFQYIPVGLLCVTHIRWFTESSIRQTLESVGFSVDVLQRQQHPATPAGEDFIVKMCKNGLADEISLRTNEIIIRAVR